MQETHHKDSTFLESSIIKYQFTQFCKRNTQAIALVLKALLQGSKYYPKEVLRKALLQENSTQDSINAQSAQRQKQISQKSSKTTHQKTAESKIDSNAPTKAPLNLEG